MNRHRLRRGAAWVALALVVSSGAAGCTQMRSIEADALIVGVGLDPGAKPATVAVLAQWFYHGAPTGSSGGGAGGGGGSGGGTQIESLVGQGATVAAAVDQVQAQTDQRVTYAALQLIVVGDSLARSGVDVPLDEFWRSDEVFPETEVAVAKGSAGGLLGIKMPSGTAFSLYQRLSASGGTATGSIPIPLWDFLARVNSPFLAAWAPLFHPLGQGYESAGTAVFRGDRLAGELGVADTATLSWLLKAGGYQDLLVPAGGPAGQTVVLRVNSRQLRVAAPDAQDGTVALDLQTQVRAGFGLQLAGADPRALEAEAATQATEDVQALLARLQAADSDVLGFGERLRERDPAAAAAWPDGFAAMHIQVRVAVHVGTSGRVG